jgi:hypothetical protein
MRTTILISTKRILKHTNYFQNHRKYCFGWKKVKSTQSFICYKIDTSLFLNHCYVVLLTTMVLCNKVCDDIHTSTLYLEGLKVILTKLTQQLGNW